MPMVIRYNLFYTDLACFGLSVPVRVHGCGISCYSCCFLGTRDVFRMINAKQLRELVVEPTLEYLDPEVPYSEDAVELLLMTAAHESRLGTYLKQVNGPALGIYQMEPATHDDIYNNYLAYKPRLEKLTGELHPYAFITEHELLVTNLMYATAMARVHYYRVPEKLPPKEDIKAMAVYAKRHYNTELGKATWEDYAEAYKSLVLGEK